MNEFVLLGVEIGLSTLISIFVVYYIGKPLRPLLLDICRKEERADFWIVFTKLMFILSPLLLVILYRDNSQWYEARYVRDILVRIIFGDLMALCLIGFVIWGSRNTDNSIKRDIKEVQ